MIDTGSGDEFAALVDRAGADARVLGVILSGSRARRGTATVHSDYDVLLIVDDDAEALLTPERRRGSPLDMWTMSLEEFRTHALPGSGSEWNRYAFTHAEVLKDTADGMIAALAGAKGRLASAEADRLAEGILDAFVNSVYRCLKNDRDGNAIGARLDGAEAVPHYLTYVFALHHRVRPYNKYLAWELERHPLSRPEWAPEVLLPRLVQAHSGEAAQAVRSLFTELEPCAREAGHGPVLDEWGDDLGFLRGEVPAG